MSVNVVRKIVDPGEVDHLDDAWELKERIRKEEGVLKQRKGFFRDAYRRSTVHMYVERGAIERVIGFAAVRRDGYMLFLAVDSDYRGEGYGKRLIAQVVDEHGSVTCHARTTNESAISFYKHLGFEVERRIDNYYEDGGDALYLSLGEDGGGLTDRLAKFLR